MKAALPRQLELSNNFGQMEFDCLLLQLQQHKSGLVFSVLSNDGWKATLFSCFIAKVNLSRLIFPLDDSLCNTRKSSERNSFIFKNVSSYSFKYGKITYIFVWKYIQLTFRISKRNSLAEQTRILKFAH